MFGKKKKAAGSGGFDSQTPPEFMAANTKFPSLSALYEAMGHKVGNAQEMEAVPAAEADAFVRDNTRYMSIADMRSAAERWLTAQEMEKNPKKR